MSTKIFKRHYLDLRFVSHHMTLYRKLDFGISKKCILRNFRLIFFIVTCVVTGAYILAKCILLCCFRTLHSDIYSWFWALQALWRLACASSAWLEPIRLNQARQDFEASFPPTPSPPVLHANLSTFCTHASVKQSWRNLTERECEPLALLQNESLSHCEPLATLTKPWVDTSDSVRIRLATASSRDICAFYGRSLPELCMSHCQSSARFDVTLPKQCEIRECDSVLVALISVWFSYQGNTNHTTGEQEIFRP